MEVERPIRRLVSRTLARIMAGWTGGKVKVFTQAELIGLGSRLEVWGEGGIMDDPQVSDCFDSGMHNGACLWDRKTGGGEGLRRKTIYSDSDM